MVCWCTWEPPFPLAPLVFPFAHIFTILIGNGRGAMYALLAGDRKHRRGKEGLNNCPDPFLRYLKGLLVLGESREGM